MGQHSFQYIECSIPAGMTAREHLLRRHEQRLTGRRRAVRLPRVPFPRLRSR